MFNYNKKIEETNKSELGKKADRMEELYNTIAQSLSNLAGDAMKDYNLLGEMSSGDEKTIRRATNAMQLLGAFNELMKTMFEYEKEHVKTLEKLNEEILTNRKTLEELKKQLDYNNELLKASKKEK